MFQLAKKLDKLALMLAWLAIISFLTLGTIGILPAYRIHPWISRGSYYAPAGFILLSMPLTFVSGWLLYHMRIAPLRIYLSIFIVASLLFLISPYFGWIAWLGLPWVIKWHIKGFETHMAEQKLLKNKPD